MAAVVVGGLPREGRRRQEKSLLPAKRRLNMVVVLVLVWKEVVVVLSREAATRNAWSLDREEAKRKTRRKENTQLRFLL